jgi:hypothetical protein
MTGPRGLGSEPASCRSSPVEGLHLAVLLRNALGPSAQLARAI